MANKLDTIIKNQARFETKQEVMANDIAYIKATNDRQWKYISRTRTALKVLYGMGSTAFAFIGGTLYFFKDKLHNIFFG